jgi:RNA 3'-terminal phosphate cyclase (ATP)
VASASLEFVPSAIVPGRHAIQVGTAGSTMLVLQAVLPR